MTRTGALLLLCALAGAALCALPNTVWAQDEPPGTVPPPMTPPPPEGPPYDEPPGNDPPGHIPICPWSEWPAESAQGDSGSAPKVAHTCVMFPYVVCEGTRDSE